LKSDGSFPTSSVLCMVTDRGGIGESSLLALIGAAARAGVDVIQIRERDLDAGALLSLTRAAMAAVSGTAARLVVNDRLDVALAAGAAGVHLRGDSFPVARVRSVAPAGFLVGRSVHSEDEAAEVDAAGGCDYLLFGSVFPSTSKPAGHHAAGLDALRRVCARVRTPVLAIGGINAAVAASARRAGASGVAAIGLFKADADVAETVRALRTAFDTGGAGV
jgi:thiamine-phosphate pyrophosphorylase